jgi:hypothetical protein
MRRLQPDAAAIVEALRPFWSPLVQAFAVDVAAELARAKLDDEIDQRSPALAELRISSRVYLEMARAKEFRSTKRGRLVVAKRREVEAALERRGGGAARTPESSPAATALDLENDVRTELGLAPKAPLRVVASGGRSR